MSEPEPMDYSAGHVRFEKDIQLFKNQLTTFLRPYQPDVEVEFSENEGSFRVLCYVTIKRNYQEIRRAILDAFDDHFDLVESIVYHSNQVMFTSYP